MTGRGTTAAMVGAYILAGAIERHCGGQGGKENLPLALKEYDQELRPFIERLQEGIAEGQWLWEVWPSSRLGVVVVNLLLKLVAILKLVYLATLLPEEGTKDGWKLPDYQGQLGKAR
jgi:2-polyprenyl-6-methoxyphenol hydroxylase-like FAD-dependent oxidoreductase